MPPPPMPDLSKLGPPPTRPTLRPSKLPPLDGDRPPGGPVPPDPTPPAAPPTPNGPAASDVHAYRRALIERARRDNEAIRLFEPLPSQKEFMSSPARVRLLRGSNRAGKTLTPAVEVAMAVMGHCPYGKYPALDGRAYAVGFNEKHLGEIMYRKLFRSGAFKIIRDEQTRRWRGYRPWLEGDRVREKDAKPAPPLIPARYVRSVTWKSKGDNVPEKVTFTTGWELDFFSSNGKPPRGSDLDLVWFDEEISDGEWYPEMSARLLDRRGRMIWGATPQTGTDQLYELHLRCEKEWDLWRQDGFAPTRQPNAREFVVLLKDNPHIDEGQKRELAADMTDQQHAVRIEGGFAVESSKIYPEFSKRIHACPYFDIGHDWTRYAVIDPGRQVCAVLFAAVPPPDAVFAIDETDDGDLVPWPVNGEEYVFLYDELYIQGCDAGTFGERMASKCAGQQFQAFVIDRHGSAITDIGSGKSVEEQYAAALARNRVECVQTGSNFTWGSDDVAGGIELVRAGLKIRGHGQPTIKCVAIEDRLPNFKWEIERYRYKRVNGQVTDKPEDRGRVHQMANLRYLVSYGPRWVEPKAGRPRPTDAYAVFQRRQASKVKRDGSGATNFGPPTRG